jgi:hypothetical protein
MQCYFLQIVKLYNFRIIKRRKLNTRIFNVIFVEIFFFCVKKTIIMFKFLIKYILYFYTCIYILYIPTSSMQHTRPAAPSAVYLQINPDDTLC